MGDGILTRRGGGFTLQALAPTITEISNTDTEIVFTITNNDASTAVILWEVDDSSPDANSLELATGVTSNNITVDSLADDTTFIVYATANVTGKIKSNVASLSIDTDRTPVYTAATGGTTDEYDDGGKRYKSHTFTSNGTFEVTTAGDADGDRNKVDYLIIAGGGAGSVSGNSNTGAGGGGAGGFRTTFGTQGGLGTLDTKPTVTATTYGVTIGAGGAGNNNGSLRNSGTNSQVAFSTTIISNAGGAGGADNNRNGVDGGSGGGSSDTSGVTPGSGTANQGHDGGNRVSSFGGGGGGAGGVGGNGVSGGGIGGVGLGSIIRTGVSETYATGARGGSNSGRSFVNADVNTGNGGEGNTSFSTGSGSGGSGIVVIRYEIAPSV